MGDMLKDGTRRGDIALLGLLPDKGEELTREGVEELIRNLQPGYRAPANLERRGEEWSLRITLDKPEGGCLRPGLPLRDKEMVPMFERAIVGYRHKYWAELEAASRNQRAQENADRLRRKFKARGKDGKAGSGTGHATADSSPTMPNPSGLLPRSDDLDAKALMPA